MHMIRQTVLPLCALLLFSCTDLSIRHRSLYPLPGEYHYTVPRAAEDGLSTGSLEGTLFDGAKMKKLDEFFGLLKKGAFGEIHGVLLSHNGTLVLEEYFPGWRFHGERTDFTAADPHHLASVTKSLTSLCVGLAIDRGFIKSADQPFLDFYPDTPVPDRTAKSGITLRHLLTMTAGLAWDETTYPYTDLRNDVVRLTLSSDPLAFILDLKPVDQPGTRWVYSGAYPNLLGDIIRRASGLRLDQFAQKYLYDPLGIKAASWVKLNGEFIYASGDAELRPRDMLKIGLMVQYHGMWNGRRVISEAWLDQSLQVAARADTTKNYGFMWWLPVLPGPVAESLGPLYMANGWGDQYIVIAPQHSLVLVVTGGNYYNRDPGTIPILSYLAKELFTG
jgi:CubicO group peptidase (beta-lactamase class C family)